MIKLIVNYGGIDYDYTRWLDFSTVNVTEQINVPGQMSFSLIGHGGAFVPPPVRSYVRLASTKINRSIFSGFVASAPNVSFLGIGQGSAPPYSQMLKYDFIASSDDYLINIKSVPFIPAFINQTQGSILKQLAEILCPGYFDTSMVEDGDLVAYYAYDPGQSWSEIAKSFGDPSRYRYHVRDKQLVYTPYGDYLLGIEYDENKGQGTFDPVKMQTKVLSVPVVNDVTVVGAAEAGNNREDYFIGDGFTTTFPLIHQVFQGASTVLLQDDWTQNNLNTQNWFVQDPGSQFDFSAGALNVVSGFSLDLGMSYIAANNGIELAGGIDLEHGEVVFNDYSSGWIGAVYENDVFGASGRLCGYNISSPAGVILSASGASGVVMQPMWGTSGVGPPIVSQWNHSYVLQTIFTAPAYARWTQVYRTIEGEEFGGAETSVNGNVTFVIQDTDIGQATGVFYQPKVTKTTINGLDLPAFAAYALIDNQQLNISLNFTLLAQLPRQNLYCNVGPCGLFVPTGLILPMLPPGSGGFAGTVLPYPDASSGNIFFPPAGLQGWVQEVVGNGFENQAAQVTAGQGADSLSFYIQTCPAAGTPIRFQSYELQAAISRLKATGSIADEAYAAGDDGLRSAVVSNLTPLPRTSEDCDNAALAFLTDRDGVFYNGSYTCTSYFLDQAGADIQYWPTCGRYLNINSPARGINNQESLVTALGITILDAVTEILQFQIQFGADLHLEKTLASFTTQILPGVLTNQDKATPPNPRFVVPAALTSEIVDPYLDDLNNVQAFWITDDLVFVTVVDNYTGNIEIRQTDSNFGTGNTTSGWIQTVYVQGGSFGTYIPIIPGQDNVSDLIENLNNTVPVSYGGGPDQINPEGYNSSYSTAIGTLYTGGRAVPPVPPHGGVPSAPAPNGFILTRQQFDQVWYMRPVSGGMTSRRSKVVRVKYPRKPAPPNIISVGSNFIQFDFDGDVRSIYGFELKAVHYITGSQKPALTCVGTGTWINVANAVASSAYASCDGHLFDHLLVQLPALTLPAGATITGIGLTCNSYYAGVIPNGQLAVNAGPLPGVAQSSSLSDIPAALVFGGKTQMWGWTSDQIAAGVAMIIQPGLIFQGTTYLNNLIATVYYAFDTPDLVKTIVQKPVASYADLNIDLTQTGNRFAGDGQNRTFWAYFFNHQWSYSDPVVVFVPAPVAPRIEVGYRFGQALDVLSNLDARIDISAQRFQVFGPPTGSTIDTGPLIIDSQLSAQTANWMTNVPATGDIYVRSYRADLISSGDWSSALFVPHGNFIASDYLAAQGSVPPILTSGTGTIFTYTSNSNVINVRVLPFEVVYPNGQQVNVMAQTGSFNQTLDTMVPLVNASGYNFYFSMDSLAFNQPVVHIDGPYENGSMSALATQVSDGRVPLTNGALTFFDSSASSGGAGGGGGGSQGGGTSRTGGNVCGVPSSLIRMADDSQQTLEMANAGDAVKNGDDNWETLNSKRRFSNVEVWTLRTANRETRVGIAHTFLTEAGGFITLFELIDLFKFNREMPRVKTIDGFETITMICDGALEDVFLLSLSGPSHVYILDGFYNHNVMYKS